MTSAIAKIEVEKRINDNKIYKKEFEIVEVENKTFIRTTTTLNKNKPIISLDEFKKDINKSLETRVKATLNSGYTLTGTDKPKEKNTLTYANGRPLVMLLGKFDPMLSETHITKFLKKNGGYAYIDRKLDGFRMSSDKSLQMGREGLEMRIPHLIEELKKLIKNDNIILDGELYLHGKNLEYINKKVNSKDFSDLEFHIYDIIDNKLTFEERRLVLKKLFGRKQFKYLKLVEVKIVKSYESLLLWFNKFREEGYEGAVLKSPKGMYKSGVRNMENIKLKHRETDEFLVVDSYSRKKKNEVTFVLETKAGLRFSACLRGSTKEREQCAIDFKSKWLNQHVEVSYESYSHGNDYIKGVPTEAVVERLKLVI